MSTPEDAIRWARESGLITGNEELALSRVADLEHRNAELTAELEEKKRSMALAVKQQSKDRLADAEMHRERVAELTARIAELEASLTEATKKQPINTSLRLFDLVRYMRAELHQEELITDEEYGQLCAGPMAMSPKGGSPSRQRLEDYDELRSQLTVAVMNCAFDPESVEFTPAEWLALNTQKADRITELEQQLASVTAEKKAETKAVLDCTRAMRLMQDEIASVTAERDALKLAIEQMKPIYEIGIKAFNK